MATIVEFVGLPGSGKSFLAAGVNAGLERTDVRVHRFVATPLTGKVRVAVRHRAFLARVMRTLAASPRTLSDRWQALRFVLVTLERYDQALRLSDDTIVLLEEGALQRLFLLLVEADGIHLARFDSLVAALPQSDLVVHVHAPATEVLDRLDNRERGVPTRLSSLAPSRVASLFEEADKMLRLAIERVGERRDERPAPLIAAVTSSDSAQVVDAILEARTQRSARSDVTIQ